MNTSQPSRSNCFRSAAVNSTAQYDKLVKEHAEYIQIKSHSKLADSAEVVLTLLGSEGKLQVAFLEIGTSKLISRHGFTQGYFYTVDAPAA